MTPPFGEATKVKPVEQPFPEQDFVYVAWVNYENGYRQGYEAAKGKQNDRS
jgi:hypothetical protein